MILRVRDKDGKVFDIPAIRGLSSYEIAVKHGFEGTEEEWLESIGVLEGKSAYEIALEEGFEGDVNEWLESLRVKGDPGPMPNISVASTFTVPNGNQAKVEIDNSDPMNPKLHFTIPEGKQGSSGSGGTSGLPSVTTSDNGKFLRVVNGVWRAESISNAEGASF